VGQVLFAGEKPHKGAALECPVISDRAPEHGIPGFEGIQYRALRHGTCDLELHLAVHSGQCPQMRRKYDANHLSSVVRESSFRNRLA